MDDFYNGFKFVKSVSVRPYVTLTGRMLAFSKSSIDMLDQAPFVHVLLNEEEKVLLVEESGEDSTSIAFVRPVPKGRQLLVRWGSREILDPIREIIGSDNCKTAIRIWGKYYPEHKAIKYDLKDYQKVAK